MLIGLVAFTGCLGPIAQAVADEAPRPLLAKGQPVDWWFVFKFNASGSFEGCGKSIAANEKRACMFGGEVQDRQAFGQQFAVASSKQPALVQGRGCLGATLTDPVGATFDQVYNGSFNYLIWNDQFYRDPAVKACKGDSCGAPWGHSKGLLAWNDAGEGFVMQVSTPAWPRSGSKRFNNRRPNAGNTLGCIRSNNNLRASQHFFALKLNKDGLIKVLDALQNAGVVTDSTKAQIVRNGGPADIQERVDSLGERPDRKKKDVMMTELAEDVILISKPSGLHVPPWQMVSSLLKNASERTATWWTRPWINTTTKTSKIKCWDQERLGEKPGLVTIVATGEWNEQEFKLTAPSNHAKIGVTTSGDKQYAIFGDLNQQGTIAPPDCDRSQNGRGGLFFAVSHPDLFESVTALISGQPAPKKP
jgi:hypothetical protein